MTTEFATVIIKGLGDLMEEIAKIKKSRSGVAVLQEPIGIKTRLRPAWETLGADAWDEFNGFEGLGLKETVLLDVEWDAGPGASSCWGVYTVTLPSGRRAYMQIDDNDEEPRLLAISEKNWKRHVDLEFLQQALSDPYRYIGNSPPSRIYTTIDSFPFLIDLFTTLFENGKSWRDLIRDFQVWNENLDNPRDPRHFDNATREIIKVDKKTKFIQGRRFDQKTPFGDLDAKLQIVARYLSQVLRTTWNK